MDTKTVFGYWKESLGWLQWPELKLLALATLNNFARSLKIMLIYFGWLFFLNLFIASIGTAASLSWLNILNFGKDIKYALLITVCSSVFLFFYFLTARASLEKKDVQYFLKYLNKLPFFLILWLLGGEYLPMIIFFFGDVSNSMHDFLASAKRGILLELYFFPGLFVLTFIFSLPIMIISGTAIFFCGALFDYPAILQSLMIFFILIVHCVLISFRAIMYSKIKHSHYQLFFSK